MNSILRRSISLHRSLGIDVSNGGLNILNGIHRIISSSESSFNILSNPQLRLFSDAGGDDEDAIVTTAPKKKRGRPPKNPPKSTDEDQASSSISKAKAPSTKTIESAPPPSPQSEPNAQISTVKKQKPPSKYKKSPPLPQGLSTVLSPYNINKPWNSDKALSDININDDVSSIINQFISIPSSKATKNTNSDRAGNPILPEASASFYLDPAMKNAKVNHIDYGCKAVSQHIKSTGQSMLLFRKTISDLLHTVFNNNPETTTNKIYVDGWTGSGKSIALYLLAALARQSGIITLYIPSAKVLTQGGRFSPSDIDGDMYWDTPESARHILRSVVDAHGEALKTILFSNTSLYDIAQQGLCTKVPREAVQACIALKDGLLNIDSSGGVKSLIVIDEYNALYSHTEYKEPMHSFYRRPISTDELRLASSFRVLSPTSSSTSSSTNNNTNATSAGCVCVVAPSYSSSISPSLRIPRPPGSTTTFRMPRLDISEVSALASMLKDTSLLPEMPSEYTLGRALALTNGNGRELTEHAVNLLHEEDVFGISKGYKVLAVERKKHARSVAEL